MLDENGNEIPEVVPGTPEVSGIEKRINEMTSKFKTFEEQALQSLASKDAMIADLVRAAAARAEPVPVVDAADDLEPEVKARLERFMNQATTPLFRQLQQLEAKLAHQEFSQVAQGEDPAILARAQQLMQAWKANGATGWVPQDAINYAAGEKYRADLANNRGRDAQRNFNQAGSGVLTGHGNQPPASQNQYKRPANFEALSIEDQTNILEKEIGDDPW